MARSLRSLERRKLAKHNSCIPFASQHSFLASTKAVMARLLTSAPITNCAFVETLFSVGCYHILFTNGLNADACKELKQSQSAIVSTTT